MAKDAEHALQLANDSDFGLSATVFTANEALAGKFARELECGGVFINGFSASDARVATKQLLTEGGHCRGDMAQHGWRVIVALPADFLAAQQQRGPFRERGLHLLMQFVTQIETRHRANIILFPIRCSHLQRRNRRNKTPGKVIGNTLFDNKARAAVTGRYQNTGQVCAAAKRFIIEEGIADDFTRRFVAAVTALKMGTFPSSAP